MTLTYHWRILRRLFLFDAQNTKMWKMLFSRSGKRWSAIKVEDVVAHRSGRWYCWSNFSTLKSYIISLSLTISSSMFIITPQISFRTSLEDVALRLFKYSMLAATVISKPLRLVHNLEEVHVESKFWKLMWRRFSTPTTIYQPSSHSTLALNYLLSSLVGRQGSTASKDIIGLILT